LFELERWTRLLKEHVHTNCEQMMRAPAGQLTHPYTVPSGPSSPYYSSALWDWDSWSTSIVLGQVEVDTDRRGLFATHERGSLLNFLDHTDADGVMPVQLKPESTLVHGDATRAGGFAENMHKPVIAQHAALLAQRERSAEWARPEMPTIGSFVDRYQESHVHAGTGLAYWQSDFAVGVDNDPSVFYRPNKSTAAVFLNSLLYRELLAYGYLLEEVKDVSGANLRRRQAQDLADAMTAYLWDERDGTFYSADLDLRPIDEQDWLHRGAPRSWSSLLLRVDSWSSFMPMWAGIASQEQAGRMVERVRDKRTFGANYGVRSLSRLEKMYDLRASNNPSNWLGPVWGITNYLVFRGLVKYGFDDDARELAEKTVRLFGRDLEASGALHEFYHPDTGDPIMTKGFQNWNFLVLNMIAWLEGRAVVAEF
jgi:putative isomerase